MPVRQPTPGPSTLTAPADVLQAHNQKKRAVSEIPPDDEPRQPKKHRRDHEIPNTDDKQSVIATVNGVKDSKKKRKKKKRKSPLTIPEIEIARAAQSAAKLEPNIDALLVSLASSSTLSETSLPSPVAANAPALNNESAPRAESLGSTAEGDEKPVLSAADKGKGRAPPEYLDNLISPTQGSAPAAGPSHEFESDSLKAAQAQIAELTAHLQAQQTLLSRHDTNLLHLQQSLTCEICLDLLYKPYALSPCGHVACYMCIIRWFTAVQNFGNANRQQPNIDPPTTPDDVPALLTSAPATRGLFLRNRKTCPLCRASITERPAEIWSIKSMVSNLIKSKLADLPSAPPSSITETSTPNVDPAVAAANDPWLNVFPRPRHLRQRQQLNQFYPAPPENNQEREEEGWGLEEMGMYDPEDGGIYRCIECMHEIWGGVCTNCQRGYPGHERFDDDSDSDGDGGDFDDDDDDDDDGGMGNNFLGRRLREIWREYNEPAIGWGLDDDEDGDEDDDEDMGEFFDAPGEPMVLTDDDHDDQSVSDDGSDLAVGEAGLQGHSDEEDHSDDEWYTDDDDDDNYNGGMYYRNLPNWPALQILQAMPARHHHHHRRHLDIEPAPIGHIAGADVDEEEEDEDGSSDSDHSHPDSDYEGSFIDDGEDDEAGRGENHRHYRVGHRHRYAEVPQPQLHGGGNPEGHNAGFDPRLVARRLGRGMRLGGAAEQHSGRRESPIVVDNDGRDGEPRAGPSNRPHTVQQRNRRRVVVAVDDSDDSDHVDGEARLDGDDEVEVTEVRPSGRRGTASAVTDGTSAGGSSSTRRGRRLAPRLYYDDSDSE